MTVRRLIALGDSHLEALQMGAELGLVDAEVSFSIVPGATAVGLRNPNSITDAINIFRAALRPQPISSHVLIHLGEVDCGFVIWWRAAKYGEEVEAQFQASLDAYRAFLQGVVAQGFTRICIAGASLPTINDDAPMGNVANKRAELKISLERRTELTHRYNEALKALAIEFGIYYFDITGSVVDRSTRLVHDFFRNPDPCDHHLDKNKVAAVWTGKCNDFLDNACISSETNLVPTRK